MATKIKSEYEAAEQEDGDIDFGKTLATLQDVLYLPFRILFSKPAQRVYLTTILFTVAGFLLAIFAAMLYFFFYYTYIPDMSVTLPVYLDYRVPNMHDQGWEYSAREVSPWGRTELSNAKTRLLSKQAYDVTVQLHLPRTHENIEMGNFMVDLALTTSEYTGESTEQKADMPTPMPGVIARSRRPSILTRRSWLLDRTTTLIGLPWYLLGWKDEAETLDIGMFENLQFARGWRNMPTSIVLRVECAGRPDIYTARVKLEARLSGLQWMMYRHRVFSFMVVTSMFWMAEMSAALMVYLVLLYYYSGSSSSSSEALYGDPQAFGAGLGRGKSSRTLEDMAVGLSTDDTDDATTTGDFDLSDTPRTFPTFSRQPPLRYAGGSPRVKIEQGDGEDDGQTVQIHTTTTAAAGSGSGSATSRRAMVGAGAGAGGVRAAPREAEDTGAEADDDYDEDEDADYVLDSPLSLGSGLGAPPDSGIGSSLDSGGGGASSSTPSSAAIADSMRRRKSSSKRSGGGGGGGGG